VRDGFTVQGNLLASDTCWPAMAAAYEEALSAGEPFVERLLRTLEAAEREGGDVRGRQSAAIMVVDASLQQAASEYLRPASRVILSVVPHGRTAAALADAAPAVVA
jgi:uncharacterized Ntn-hydrolase superfamily protein